ncbi:MAG: thermonuclease family protein [Sphingomonas sp.]|uniref:thermonuclease family protein n=1 Tax=Sphingomonas sp. TaxID=28214 RepID=UPI0012192CF1|nr:thermonuclease family protein [Sphingomonas sp.]THD37880.1 MAG: thermonuclease family protein [Sphingomonas sp.]
MGIGGETAKNIGIVLGGGALAGLAAGALTAGHGPPAAAAGVAPAPIVASFGLCHTGGGTNCVVDGDTFWIDGEKVRVADIDAPETHPPRCAHEADLGERATLRLQALLNAGPVTLAAADRDTDRYGRLLRIVERNGRSLGGQLVAEGLARPWTGRRLPWCDGD